MSLQAPSGTAEAFALANLPTAVDVKFTGVVLVCGDCQARGNGPRKLRARDVRQALKHEFASHQDGTDARFRLRVVQCTCLGLCPKKAMALVAVRSGPDAPVGAEVKTTGDVNAFGRRVVQLGRP